ncbi:MAG: M20/M25/M40 family metallo-hydrolase [Kiritimatiellae bacterium]|nr:M20/M25/M40 family metallo-hydrolase [Kiritimatiellia bacterium]
MTTETLLRTMMRFRPVSADIEAVNRLVEFLRGHLRQNGLYTRLENVGARKILYAATRKGKTSPVLLNAHLDVVPAEPKTFRIRKRGDWITGRGAGDCLGNCAVAARVLIQCRDRAHVAAVFSTDEEIGGATTRHMVQKGYAGDFVVILDGEGYQIAVAQKGILGVRLQAKGRGCHGSTPWKGRNAIDRLIDGYLRVRKLFPPVQPGREWRDTLSANIISGGTVFNRVPDAAELSLDIRYTGRVSRAALLRRIRAASGLNVVAGLGSPVVFCDETHAAVRQLIRVMRRRLRRNIPAIRLNGATDARHFAPLKVPIAIIGAPSRGAHSDRDAVNLKGLLAYADLLTAFCTR